MPELGLGPKSTALSLVLNKYSVQVTRLGAVRVPDLLLGAWQDLSGSDCLHLSPMEAVCQRTGLGKQEWSSFTAPTPPHSILIMDRVCSSWLSASRTPPPWFFSNTPSSFSLEGPRFYSLVLLSLHVLPRRSYPGSWF